LSSLGFEDEEDNRSKGGDGKIKINKPTKNPK
jgi:hypothetical protein